MSTSAGDVPNEENGSLFSDEWIRDVAKMGLGWLVGTVIAIVLLLFVGPMVF